MRRATSLLLLSLAFFQSGCVTETEKAVDDPQERQYSITELPSLLTTRESIRIGGYIRTGKVPAVQYFISNGGIGVKDSCGYWDVPRREGGYHPCFEIEPIQFSDSSEAYSVKPFEFTLKTNVPRNQDFSLNLIFSIGGTSDEVLRISFNRLYKIDPSYAMPCRNIDGSAAHLEPCPLVWKSFFKPLD